MSWLASLAPVGYGCELAAWMFHLILVMRTSRDSGMAPPSIDTIRDWLASNMPSLSSETENMSERECHAKLCEYVEMDYEYGELVNLRVLHRKLKQSHFGG
jgi:hypothetical protein